MKLFKWRNLEIERRDQAVTNLFTVLAPVIAIVLSFAVGAVIIALAGANPLVAYSYLAYGAFGTPRMLAETAVRTVPLLLAGLGLALAYRCGAISIGAEGQMVMGGIFAAVVGIYLNAPAWLLLPLTILAGFAGGALWGAIPGLLKAKLGVSEIINTIMLNYIAIYLMAYLLDIPMREPPGYFPQSAPLQVGARLPVILSGTRLHAGFLLALAMAGLVYLIMFRLPLGFRIRAVGFNPHAARYAGINVERNIILAMLLSGGLAGLAGVGEVAGVHYRLLAGFSSQYGFDAIAVALLGKLHPTGVILSAAFFGALRVGANMMQRSVQVPAAVVFVIQGLAVLFVLGNEFLRRHIVRLVLPARGAGQAAGTAKGVG
ncbi:MAG: ABC transporter permease [Bacillota bacterium]